MASVAGQGFGNRVVLRFDTVDEFYDAFERRAQNTGFFHPSYSPLALGQGLTIVVSIRGIYSPLLLQGSVLWRRVRAGGHALPAGSFVVLTERDRDRFDKIVAYLRGITHDDRRSQVRYPVFLQATYMSDTGRHPSETVDLSVGGAFLRCSGPLLLAGEQVPVLLYFTETPEHGIMMNGRVAWTSYFRERRGMGVSFDGDQPNLGAFQLAFQRIEQSWRWLQA